MHLINLSTDIIFVQIYFEHFKNSKLKRHLSGTGNFVIFGTLYQIDIY